MHWDSLSFLITVFYTFSESLAAECSPFLKVSFLVKHYFVLVCTVLALSERFRPLVWYQWGINPDTKSESLQYYCWYRLAKDCLHTKIQVHLRQQSQLSTATITTELVTRIATYFWPWFPHVALWVPHFRESSSRIPYRGPSSRPLTQPGAAKALPSH